MNRLLAIAATGLLVSLSSVSSRAAELVTAPVTIGSHLQTLASVRIQPSVPAGGLEMKITSDDPARLLITTLPDTAGAPSITFKLNAGFRESPDFWLQALASSGTVTYTVTAPGCEPVKGTVTLAPSGVVLVGPIGSTVFSTTSRAVPTRITAKTMMLDASLKAVAEQMVAGGKPVQIKLNSSAKQIGTVSDESLTLGGGTSFAYTQFKPASPGDTTLTATVPAGFSRPAVGAEVNVKVIVPGMAITTQSAIGKNLQIAGVLSLGEAAPASGLVVTLTSSDKSKLLVSPSATEVGGESVRLNIPPGAISANYYIQALGDSGPVTYTATAPGYRERVGTITLAPSGVLITPAAFGPPDEGEYMQPNVPEVPRRFLANLSTMKSVPLVLWTAQLDPVSKRGADITVQPLRAGLRLEVSISNSNPEVGTFPAVVTIEGGAEHTAVHFVAKGQGTTDLIAATPPGFTTPSNATKLTAFVKP